jgi:hypothetical protein
MSARLPSVTRLAAEKYGPQPSAGRTCVRASSVLDPRLQIPPKARRQLSLQTSWQMTPMFRP